MGMLFVHVLICVLVLRRTVGLNVSLVLTVVRIRHVLIKNATIRVVVCAVSTLNVKLLTTILYVVVLMDTPGILL